LVLDDADGVALFVRAMAMVLTQNIAANNKAIFFIFIHLL
jgi:hypothetical protein